MEQSKDNNGKQIKELFWFEIPNRYDDVVLSTRLRLIRNLADYPFVVKMSKDDKIAVTKIAKENFSDLNNFNFIYYDDLSDSGLELLKDKNIISDKKCTGIVLNNKQEDLFCLINESDHFKIVGFTSGLDCEKLMERVYKLDEKLQTKVSYAVSSDFGYLTSKIRDCGSGMKITLRVFIPSIIMSGKIDYINKLLKENKYCLKPVFGMKGEKSFSKFIYDIYPGNAIDGTELEQMAKIQSVGMKIVKTERKIRQQFADNNPTIVLNFFKRSYAKSMYSLLLDYEDGVSIIATIKWCLNIGLIKGISSSSLNSLLYRTKLGHLKYLCNNYNFTFEDDIKNSLKLQVKRLRTIVIQQAFEGIVNEHTLS